MAAWQRSAELDQSGTDYLGGGDTRQTIAALLSQDKCTQQYHWLYEEKETQS